ncbi:restriction endonuclease subunit S [Methanoculleus sp.]|uniref:restriction endonuclease subunit S n=1 Tax=Methanoculleus sp. TaxID=90427 RepID=UPI0025ED105B|nr:restriction endonuclease subunit S [Methanoculleus sp.]
MPERSEVPEGWEWVTLPQVADICMGQSPPGSSYNEEGIGLPFFQGKADFTDYHPTIRVYCTEPKKIVKPGAILISVRAPVGPTNVADRVCTIGRGLAGLTPLAGVPTNYILYNLRYKEPEIALWGTGSTFTAINKGHLESIELLLPPLAEQHRIVAAIEALFARLDAANARLERVPGILKQFRQAVLAAACDGRLTEDWRAGSPQDWLECKVVDIAQVKVGGTPSRKKPQFWNGTIPWVSSGEVANNHIHSTREHITELGLENSNAKIYPKGTILIAMIGEGKTRGQSAYLEIEACTNQNVAGIVPDIQKITSDFLWYWSLSKYEDHRKAGRGGEQPALNKKIISEMQLSLPPLPEQNEIVRRVEALLALTDRIEAEVAAARAKTETMRQSILAQAFSGRLVPTEAGLARREGREYEPASVLLERIHSEKKEKTGRRGTQSTLV